MATSTALAAALRPDTRFVFAETFTNPLGRAQDIPALVALVARMPGARLVIDSTIATPWGIRTPLLDQGVDVVIGSMTKALGGQDAALGGYIATNDAERRQPDHGSDRDARRHPRRRARPPRRRAPRRRPSASTRAAARPPRRSPRSSRAHPRVERCSTRSRPDHPDAAVIARDYMRTGSLLAFRVKEPTRPRTAGSPTCSCRAASLRYALSFDGLVTKVNHHKTVSEYFTPPENVARLGIDRLIRLGIGLEDADDLIACLNWTLGHPAM